MRPLPAAAALLAVSLSVGAADEPVLSAVAGLYSRLEAGDADSLGAYLPQNGFTEFSPPANTLQTLDAEFFRRAFASGVRIRLHVEQAQARVRGPEAIVTGYRVGSIAFADGGRLDVHDCMTMVWGRDRGDWKLQHVHISACPAS